MNKYPYCASEDIYFSKKRKLFVCEECDKTFSEHQLSEGLQSKSSDGGLELFFSYGHDRNRIKPPATVSDIQWLDMSEWYEIKTASASDFEQWYKEKFAELCKAIESSESVELNGDIHILKTKLVPYLNSEKEYNLLSKKF